MMLCHMTYAAWWIPWCADQRDGNPHLDHMLFFSSDQSQKQADSRSPSSVMGHAGPGGGRRRCSRSRGLW